MWVRQQVQGNSDTSSLDEDLSPLQPLRVSKTHSRSSTRHSESDANETMTAPPPPVVNYSILREPLLEEGVADLVPLTT